MKLDKHQRVALAIWLGEKVPGLSRDHSVVSGFDEFCDGEITEWRVIYTFGLAGKIWNVHDKIYISGHSQYEIGKREYNQQQELINKWNSELEELMAIYG